MSFFSFSELFFFASPSLSWFPFWCQNFEMKSRNEGGREKIHWSRKKFIWQKTTENEKKKKFFLFEWISFSFDLFFSNSSFCFHSFPIEASSKKTTRLLFHTLSLFLSLTHTHTILGGTFSLTLTHVPAPSHSCTHTTGMYPFFDGLKGATAIELFANFIWQVSKVVSLRNGSWYQTSNFGPEMLLFRKRASAIGGSGLALSSNVIVTALKFKNGD